MNQLRIKDQRHDYNEADDDDAFQRGKLEQAAKEEDYFDEEVFEAALNKVKRPPTTSPKQHSTRRLKPKLKFRRKDARRIAVLSNKVDSINLHHEEGRMEATLSLCSLNAMRVAIDLLFRVNAETDERFWTFKTTAYELSRAIGLNYDLNRIQVKKLLDEVASLVYGDSNPGYRREKGDTSLQSSLIPIFANTTIASVREDTPSER
jgi:hypothetical protein